MDADTKKAVVALLAERGPVVLSEHYAPGPRCIAATRMALDVCSYFGIPCKPFSVDAVIANEQAWAMFQEIIERGPMPDEERDEMERGYGEKGAWIVEVSGSAEGEGYSGHVVLGIDVRHDGLRSVIDLDARQFERPNKDIAIPHAVVVGVTDEWWDTPGVECDWRLPTGIYYTLTRPVKARPFQYAPDWKKKCRASSPMIREIREALGVAV